MCRSHVKFESFVEKNDSFSARTEKFPSESPLASMRMLEPVMPGKWIHEYTQRNNLFMVR